MNITYRRCATCIAFKPSQVEGVATCLNGIGFVERQGDGPEVLKGPQPDDCCEDHQTEEERQALGGETCL